jgi:hypothetical protein
MRILKNCICLLFVILLTSCTNAVWVHRDFDNMRNNVETISIMPPQIQYYERKAGSTEPEPEHNLEVSNNLNTALKEVLEEKDFIVKPSGLTDSILADSQDLALCFIRSQKRFHVICDSVGRLGTKKETYKMNPEISIFADIAGVNYLLFSRGLAFSTTEGGQIKDAIFTGLKAGLFRTYSPAPQKEGLSMELLLVDANRAEAIWYNGDSETTGLNPFELKPVKRHCKLLLCNKLMEKE